MSFAKLSQRLLLVSCLAAPAVVGCAAAPTGNESSESADLSDEAVESSTDALTSFRCDATDDTSHSTKGEGGSLHAVRASAHPEAGFDRFVMEFEPGVSPDDYLVTRNGGTVFYGTGEQSTKVQGEDGIAVIFKNGEMLSTYHGPLRVRFADAKGIKEAAQYDQFEGNIEWALGTQRNPCWRTTTLQNPPRLIVDVKR
jgi:hypothetical protein